MGKVDGAFLSRYIASLDSIPGWFSPDAAILLVAYHQLVAPKVKPGDILEIGVYHGKSAILLAALLRASPSARPSGLLRGSSQPAGPCYT
jgi:hypothetical protein